MINFFSVKLRLFIIVINNYFMIRIFQEDVFNDNNDWDIRLKKILNEHDNEDKLYIKFIGDKELYQFLIDNI